MTVLEPVYAQDIVVGVIFHKTFSWYITGKEYWFLDYIKYKHAFIASNPKFGRLLPQTYSDRFDIAILNEDTAEEFLSNIRERCVLANTLSQMMLGRMRHDKRDDLLDFLPCFLVDFDQKQFSSLYPEMIRFEAYIPDGWIGTHRNFLPEIPESEKYWIINGENVFEKQLRPEK